MKLRECNEERNELKPVGTVSEGGGSCGETLSITSEDVEVSHKKCYHLALDSEPNTTHVQQASSTYS